MNQDDPNRAMDIAVYDRTGSLKAAIEVKAIRGTDAAWAKAYRQNLVELGGPIPGDYFLVVTPDHAYLWSQIDDMDDDPAVFETAAWLGPYLETLRTTMPSDGFGLEWILATWLDKIVRKPLEELPESLRQSKLGALLSGARVGYPIAA